MKEMIAFVKKENVVNIKINSIKGQLANKLKGKLIKQKTKSQGRKSPKVKEDKVVDEDSKPEEKAYDRLTKDNLKEVEIEYYLKMLKQKEQVKTMTAKEE